MPTAKNVSKVPPITPALLEQNEQEQQRWRSLYTAPHVSQDSHANRIIRDNLNTLDRLEKLRKSAKPVDRPALTERIKRLKDDTAIWCDSVGQFSAAAQLTSCKHQRRLYRLRAAAIDLPDDEWCEHPVFENVDGHIQQVAARERDFFSHKHGKEWQFGLSGLDAAADLRGELSDYAPGSRNLLPDGLRQSRAFRDLDILGTGGRRMVQIRDTWGALDDDGSNIGKGSLFSSIADMLVYCGRGQVRVETALIPGAIASAVLKFLLKWNGSYTDPESGPYAAGLPEPNKPTVGIIDGDIYGAPNLTGTVSIKSARLRKTTGGRSRASATSDVITIATGEHKSIYAVCDPIVTGQTHHVFFGTDTKLGGIGLHYRIARANPFTNDEYREADVERNVSITAVTGGNVLNAAAGTFTAGDIGKLAETVGGSGITFRPARPSRRSCRLRRYAFQTRSSPDRTVRSILSLMSAISGALSC
jgi:hypothetical protein